MTTRSTGWIASKDHYAVPVMFNPYTGEPRDVRDVQSDPQGILIVPPGKVEMLATPPAQAAPDVLDRARIREIFMAHGFTVKVGQTDLKQYVYDAAEALLAAQREAKP